MRQFSQALLAMRKLARVAKRLRRRILRQEWAAARGEYECYGGPPDGEVIKGFPRTAYYTVHGVYREELDYRLHYHTAGSGQHAE